LKAWRSRFCKRILGFGLRVLGQGAGWAPGSMVTVAWKRRHWV
jgi:hypothetical protein